MSLQEAGQPQDVTQRAQRTQRKEITATELRKQGLQVERQMPIRIYYDELVFDEGFRASLRPWRPLRELAGEVGGDRRMSRKGRKGRKGKR